MEKLKGQSYEGDGVNPATMDCTVITALPSPPGKRSGGGLLKSASKNLVTVKSLMELCVRGCKACVKAAPVLARELRAESRRTVNFWLRVLAAGVIILVFAGFMFSADLEASQFGPALFGVLHQTLFFGFWIVAPLMTADCIGREKREGTLGLLFLTPLTVLEVILGKSAIHILRALTLFLAAVPIVVISFVLGGVGWIEVSAALMQEATALLLGIGAGIYASTKGGSTVQSMILAEAYALSLAVIAELADGFIRALSFPLYFGWLWYLGSSLLFALFLFGAVLNQSVRRLQNTWKEESASIEQPRWVKTFSDSEFWRLAFRWDTSRTLDRNPMAWLQEYSWTARLTKWGWFLLLLVLDLMVLNDWYSGGFRAWVPLLTTGLALGVAFSAAGSFRRERQTGLLEVMLVTPLSAGQIIGGRVWGLFCNYFPAIAALMVCWAGDRIINPNAYKSGLLPLLLPNPFAFGAIMLLGLYLSLGRLNFLLAAILTWVVAFVMPSFATVALGRWAKLNPLLAAALPSALQIALAVSMWFLVMRNLRTRAFLRA